MLIWIDLANSPHVPFFRALIGEFTQRGHSVEVTARRFAQTVELAERAQLNVTIVGEHGGRALKGKVSNLLGRARALRVWARERAQVNGAKFDLAVSHNSYAQIVAARLLNVKAVTLMDYEHQPANHLAFRLATRVIVPRAFPDAALRRFGARQSKVGANAKVVSKVRKYDGIKEDVYLADFAPDDDFANELRALGVAANEKLIVVRPPARDALYHRFENELFDRLIEKLCDEPHAKILMLPRTHEQRQTLETQYKHCPNLIFPAQVLDGASLIFAADLVVSAGGTMNREAAALGVPAATVFAGRAAAIDEWLIETGRLRRIASLEDVARLRVEKRSRARSSDAGTMREQRSVRGQVADLILES